LALLHLKGAVLAAFVLCADGGLFSLFPEALFWIGQAISASLSLLVLVVALSFVPPRWLGDDLHAFRSALFDLTKRKLVHRAKERT
jgi:hypothetical protein